MEAALRALKMKDLKKRARAFGVTGDELDDAEDEDDAKGAVVALVLAKGAALKALKPRELKAQARELGVDPDDLDDCLDEDDPKEAMVLLMLKAAERSEGTPTKPPAAAEEGTPAPQDATPPQSGPPPTPLSASGGASPTAASPTGGNEKKIMAVCVEIKEQLGLEGSINPAATAAAGREALGMAAAVSGTKLKENLQQICLELGIETGWAPAAAAPSEGVPPQQLQQQSSGGDSPTLNSPSSSGGGDGGGDPQRTRSASTVLPLPDGGSLKIKEVIGRGGQVRRKSEKQRHSCYEKRAAFTQTGSGRARGYSNAPKHETRRGLSGYGLPWRAAGAGAYQVRRCEEARSGACGKRLFGVLLRLVCCGTTGHLPKQALDTSTQKKNGTHIHPRRRKVEHTN
jgi:hypothetical protein